MRIYTSRESLRYVFDKIRFFGNQFRFLIVYRYLFYEDGLKWCCRTGTFQKLSASLLLYKNLNFLSLNQIKIYLIKQNRWHFSHKLCAMSKYEIIVSVMYRISSSTSIPNTIDDDDENYTSIFHFTLFLWNRNENEMKIQLSLMPMSIISYQVSIGFANKYFLSNRILTELEREVTRRGIKSVLRGHDVVDCEWNITLWWAISFFRSWESRRLRWWLFEWWYVRTVFFFCR